MESIETHQDKQMSQKEDQAVLLLLRFLLQLIEYLEGKIDIENEMVELFYPQLSNDNG